MLLNLLPNFRQTRLLQLAMPRCIGRRTNLVGNFRRFFENAAGLHVVQVPRRQAGRFRPFDLAAALARCAVGGRQRVTEEDGVCLDADDAVR